MNLKEEIRKLIELQEIDSKIYSLTRSKDIDKPSEIESLKKDFEDSKSVILSLEKKFKELQLGHKGKELELSSKEEAVRKSQSQLYQLKTNKEYQAKLSEINSLKADVSVIEESVINILDELEKAEKELETARNKMAARQEAFVNNKKKIDEEIKQLEIEINSLRDKRNIISKNVDAKILSVYDKLIETRSGLAIVSVENNSCGACHMNVTAQKINEIKMYKNLVFCDMCVRILYVKEDFQL